MKSVNAILLSMRNLLSTYYFQSKICSGNTTFNAKSVFLIILTYISVATNAPEFATIDGKGLSEILNTQKSNVCDDEDTTDGEDNNSEILCDVTTTGIIYSKLRGNWSTNTIILT